MIGKRGQGSGERSGLTEHQGRKLVPTAVGTADLNAIRTQLIRLGGETAADLGLGRLLGEVLVYLYLRPHEVPLEKLVADLDMSKPAMSIATRQLEHLGVIERVRHAGDRRHYYRTVANIGTALQAGLLKLIRSKLAVTGEALEEVSGRLGPDPAGGTVGEPSDAHFLRSRIHRSQELHRRFSRLLNNPLVRWLGGAS